MKVLHICSSLSRMIGGPARSVQGLVAGLESAGVETCLLAMKPIGDPWVKGVGLYRNAGCKSWRDARPAIEAVVGEFEPDLIQVHSIWQWALHIAASVAYHHRIPYVMTPRGTIEKWSLRQKYWKKKIARLLYQDRDFMRAAAIHCTAESEVLQAKALFPGKRIIYCPNGVNIPEALPPRVENGKERRALFMSRMHPKKGVLDLIKVWAKVRPAGWTLELVYTVGSDFERAYEQEVRNAVEEAGLSRSVLFTGAIMDERKWEAYARADLFILASYSENFGIVVAEALYASVPVITTTGTPWRELNDCKCGWCVDVGVPSIADALRQATSMPTEELKEMGLRGRQLADRKYLWPSIGQTMRAAYEEILKEGKQWPRSLNQ